MARAALDAGAAIVNDVSALRLDPEPWREWWPRAGAGVILMHSRGSILEIASYTHAEYEGDVVGEVVRELREALDRAAWPAWDRRRQWWILASASRKTVEQNIVLFDQLRALQALGRPVLVGPSRKRFLGAVTGLSLEERDRVTATACALAGERGARLFRVHAVAETRETLALTQSLGVTGLVTSRSPYGGRLRGHWSGLAGLSAHVGSDGHVLGCRRVHRGG